MAPQLYLITSIRPLSDAWVRVMRGRHSKIERNLSKQAEADVEEAVLQNGNDREYYRN